MKSNLAQIGIISCLAQIFSHRVGLANAVGENVRSFTEILESHNITGHIPDDVNEAIFASQKKNLFPGPDLDKLSINSVDGIDGAEWLSNLQIRPEQIQPESAQRPEERVTKRKRRKKHKRHSDKSGNSGNTAGNNVGNGPQVDVSHIPPSDSPDRWYRKIHPYYAYIQTECATELRVLCKDSDDFFVSMSCLEDMAKTQSTIAQIRTHRKMPDGQISERCSSAIISGSGTKPNPLIFQEHTRMRYDFSSLGIGVDTIERVFGYVEAPLLYSDPQSTSLLRSWFQIIPCAVQPSPKGMLFYHLGGPSPGITSFPLFLYEREEWRFILKNYDVVISDQRGMGLSAMDYLAPWAIDMLPTNPDEFLSFANEFDAYRGNLYIVSLKNAGGFAAPCYSLLTSFDTVPDDFTNTADVTQYLRKRSKMIAQCSKLFNKYDGANSTYNILQFMGTHGHIHDIEWMRMALGSPKISIAGYSYGTRVAAAYAGQFPNQIRRMAVSGVMGPIPDILDYAREAARNTAEIFGLVNLKCNAAGEICSENPVGVNDTSLYEPGFYFEGNVDDAVDELLYRSSTDFYTETCNGTLSMQQVTQYFAVRSTSMIVKQGQFQDQAWPVAMLEIPTSLFLIIQNPCRAVTVLGETGYIVAEVDTFNLIPALDMAGRWSSRQVGKFISDFAKDVTMTPSLTMFSLYAKNANGWPQLPAPIAFSNPDVDVVIAQSLYDQRTGMNMAQLFQLNFPRSNMVVAPVAGHCVTMRHGVEANKLMKDFLLYAEEPPNGYISDMPPKEMDFSIGRKMLQECLETSVEECLY